MVAYLKWFSKYLHCFVYIDTMHTDQYMSRTLAIQSAYPQFPAVWCQFLHVLTSRCLYSQHIVNCLASLTNRTASKVVCDCMYNV